MFTAIIITVLCNSSVQLTPRYFGFRYHVSHHSISRVWSGRMHSISSNTPKLVELAEHDKIDGAPDLQQHTLEKLP